MARLVRLTAEARALVPKLAKLADANDRAFFDCLSRKEQATIVDLMQRLVAHHSLTNIPIE